MISTVSRESAPRSTNLDSGATCRARHHVRRILAHNQLTDRRIQYIHMHKRTVSRSVPSCSAMISRTSARTSALSCTSPENTSRSLCSSSEPKSHTIHDENTYNCHHDKTLGTHGTWGLGLNTESDTTAGGDGSGQRCLHC